MRITHVLIIFFLFLTFNGYSQCKDSIYVPFTNTLPIQGGIWASNSIVFGDSIRCGGTSNVCALSKPNYVEFNGLGDFIRTPLIPNPSVFSFFYRRSGTTPNAHRVVVETSPDGTTWTTQVTITTFTTTYTKVTLNVNNVFVRIRDIRTTATDTKLWYLDDVKWVWEANVGVWTGSVSSDWNNSSNWCKGQIPTSSDNILIPQGTPFSCVLSSGIGQCNNLTIENGVNLTINNATLRIFGNINSSSNIIAKGGTIQMNGTLNQTIKGSNLSQKLLGNLIIGNPAGVSLGNDATDSLKLLNCLSFSTTNTSLTTGGALTLCSSDTLTARIDDLTNNRIIGNVVVERFIPNHSKAWQLLAVPTIGQSINSSWQEGNTPLGNNRLGYGTIVTGSGIGFDITSSLPSMKFYNPNTNLWDGVTNTSNLINTNKGYMLFVRGDRSVTGIAQPATSTIMRTTGQLYTPTDNPPPTINVETDKYECVNNFYASAIDFSKLSKTGGIQNTFYVWDPKLTNSSVSAYGFGGYQTFVWNGAGYTAVPGGGSYSMGNTNIESGTAFFVKTFGSSGTISFTESSKSTGSNVVTRISNNFIKTDLYSVINGEPILLDGVISLFGNYTNDVDFEDIKKIGVGEGIGLLRNNIRLTAEFRRTIIRQDTIFLNLTSLRRQTYQFIIEQRIPNITCILVDNFLNTNTQIYSGAEIMFQVTDAQQSYAPNRFYLIVSGLRKPTVLTLKNEFDFTCSPNPAHNSHINLSINGENGKYKVSIFNIFGKKLYNTYLLKNSEKQTFPIYTNLGFGVYEIVVEKNTKKSTTLIFR